MSAGDEGRPPSPAARLLSARPRFRFAAWALSIGLALAVIGFAAAAQWKSSVARQEYTTSAQQVLAAQVVGLEQEQRTLRDQLADAERQVQGFQTATAGSQTTLAGLNRQLALARLAAGLTKVSGPGVVILAIGCSMYAGAWPTASRRSKLALTALAVSAAPLWNLTPGRSLNV